MLNEPALIKENADIGNHAQQRGGQKNSSSQIAVFINTCSGVPHYVMVLTSFMDLMEEKK